MGRRQIAEWKLKTEEDVVVRLLDSSNHSCLLALPLHSHVLLDRSGFFSARLSERWNSAPHHPSSSSCDAHPSGGKLHDPHDLSSCNHDLVTFGKCDDFEHDRYDALLHSDHHEHAGLHAIDIAMPDPSAAPTYERCIELMYVPHSSINSCRPFSGVEDAVSMLYVAAELLFHDGVDACMVFLEMFPSWTPEEEASIRATLSSLQLPYINADLAARLSLPQTIPSHEPMRVMRSMLVHVLQLACERLPATPPAMKNIDPSKPIPEATILLAWNGNMDLIKKRFKEKLKNLHYDPSAVSELLTTRSSLSWLLSKLLALQASDAVVKAFAKDTQLSNVTQDFIKRLTQNSDYRSYIYPVLSLLDHIMQVVLCGDVLLSQSARFTLITTWLPVAQAMPSSSYDSYGNIVDGFPKLISSMPVLGREQIYKTFMKKPYERDMLNLSCSFGPWCDLLRNLHVQHGQGQEGLLAKDDA